MATDSSQNTQDNEPASHPGDVNDNAAKLTLSQTLLLFAKGIAMGLGDSVPGISGGTVAVITNIYDRLIYSIRSVDQYALSKLFQGQIKQAWRHINGNFLLVLALGMLAGLLLSANTVLYLLDNQFELLMGFFIGLVLASSILLLPQISLNQPTHCIALLLGVSITVGIGLVEPVRADPSPLYLFLCGGIAISAMILPGLSGAFILLLLGAYEHMLTALVEFQLATIAVFVGGCVCGLLAFSRLIAWLLQHYHSASYSVIIGMLLGSLSVLWPWQQVLTVYIDSDGVEHPLQTGLVWPLNYTEITGQDPRLWASLVALLAGAAIVVGLQRIFAAKK